MSGHAAIKSEPISDDNTVAVKGKPLGSIMPVKRRLQTLGVVDLERLHLLLFDRDEKMSSVLYNIENFQGFSFSEGSAEYKRKKATLEKLRMDELNELIFRFDLNTKLQRKSERIEEILKFLMFPRSKRSSKIFKCHNLGCGETFPNITARNRHKKSCSHQTVYFCKKNLHTVQESHVISLLAQKHFRTPGPRRLSHNSYASFTAFHH